MHPVVQIVLLQRTNPVGLSSRNYRCGSGVLVCGKINCWEQGDIVSVLGKRNGGSVPGSARLMGMVNYSGEVVYRL